MSDIRQEWNELKEKNANFINHIDGEMAKIETKQVELKRREKTQDMADARAFAMQFVAPPPFNCCQNDHDILKALNKAQADRIKQLEDKILAYKEQKQIDLAVAKEVDEKLAKATADYRALWVEYDRLKSQLAGAKAQCENAVENRRRISELSQEVITLREQQKNAAKSYARLATERNNLAETISRMEKTIRDLDERNGNLRECLAQTNASLKRSIQKESQLQSDVAYLRTIRESLAKEIESLRAIVDTPNGSCSAYTQQGMQSKIANQANEIRRLTEENEGLKHDNKALANGLSDRAKRVMDLTSAQTTLKHEIETLHGALDVAAKDAEANFERGKIKGMKEIWKELVDCYDGRPIGENNKIFGYHTVGDILMNLSPTWFMNKAEEYHKQEEKKEQQAKDIQLGDEVEIFDKFCPDDDPHSDIGIVVMIYEPQTNCEPRIYTVVGPKFEAQIDDTDIVGGVARKTGEHYDSIPFDYLT